MALKEGKQYLMTKEKKKNAGYEGEADQRNCRKKFSNAHIMRNGYYYNNRYLVIKASCYMLKGKR